MFFKAVQWAKFGVVAGQILAKPGVLTIYNPPTRQIYKDFYLRLTSGNNRI